MDESGALYEDRSGLTDDFGKLLNPQKDAICSSLRGEPCQSVTNNAAKTHNLFNYFPNHATESVVAHANARFNAKHLDPHSLKQAMDDRTLSHLSRQNPHLLGTKPTQIRSPSNTLTNAQSVMEGINSLLGSTEPLKHVGSRTIKYNKKKKRTKQTERNKQRGDSMEETQHSESAESATSTLEDSDHREDVMEETEVEIEFYSADNSGNLASVLGLDENEAAEAVDSIVQQLITSYLGMC